MTTPLDPGLWLGQPEPEPEPEYPPTAQRRRPRRVLFVALIAIGVLLIVGGVGALGREMTRAATPAEASAALQKEIATRWERLPAGKIFPATVGYTDAEGTSRVARLVGIAPRASCQAALGAAGYAVVHGLGCAAILRATYIDGSGALAATIGIAVLRSPAAAQQAWSSVPTLSTVDGLRSVPFSGTAADQFGDPARGTQGGMASGPYLYLYTAGFTDGLPAAAAADQQSELNAFGTGVDVSLEAVLTGHSAPCTMKDIAC